MPSSLSVLLDLNPLDVSLAKIVTYNTNIYLKDITTEAANLFGIYTLLLTPVF